MAEDPVKQPTDGDLSVWQRVFRQADEAGKQQRQLYDRYADLYSEGGLKPSNLAIGEGKTEGTSVNETFPHVQTVLSIIAASDPSFEAEPTPGDGGMAEIAAAFYLEVEDLKQAFADTLKNVLTNTWIRQGMYEDMKAVTFNAVVKGMGYVKLGWDAVKNIDRMDCIPRDMVFVDPMAEYKIQQGSYVIQTVIKKLQDAREFFGKFGVPPERIEANYNMVGGEDEMGAKGKAIKALLKDTGDADKNLFRFYEVWSRERGQEVLRYKESGTAIQDDWILETDWPFKLDTDDFPFETLVFNRKYAQAADAFPDLQIVEALRKANEEFWDFFVRHTKRSIAKKIFIDDDVFKDPETENRILSADDLKVVRGKLGGRKFGDVFQIVGLNDGDRLSVEAAQLLLESRNRVTMLDNIVRGGQNTEGNSRMTATEARARAEWSEMKANPLQNIFDRWLAGVTRKRAQILRLLLPKESVRAFVSGPEGELAWQTYAGNYADMIGQYSIGVASGSTGERHKQAKIGRLLQAMTQGQALNQAYGAPIVRLPVFYRELLGLLDYRRPSRFLDEKLYAQVTQAQMMNPAMMAQPQNTSGAPPGVSQQVPAGPMVQPEVPPPEMEGAPIG